MAKKNIEGEYIKVQFMFIHKQRNENNWKAGIVIECYEHFACIQFENYKKCFTYDELIVIDKKEYEHLLQQKLFKKSLIFVADIID